MFWIFHIFGKNRINNHRQIQVNNSFSFKLSLKILLVSGNRSLTWTRYLNIEVPRWALLDPVNESLWSRHDIQKPVGVKMRCDVAYKKVEVEKKKCYHTVNGRNVDLVDMEHIPYFCRVLYIQTEVGCLWTIRICQSDSLLVCSLSFGGWTCHHFGLDSSPNTSGEVWEVTKHHSLNIWKYGPF